MPQKPDRNDCSAMNSKENSLLVYPLLILTRLSLVNPVQTIVLALVAALLCGYMTVTHLKFKTSRLDLINQKSDFNKLWIDYIEDFGDEDDLVVVVEGSSQEEITPVLDELSEKMKSFPKLFRSVLHEIDTAPLLRKGLHFIENEQDLAHIHEFALHGAQIAAGHWEYLNAEAFLGGLCRELAPPAHSADPSIPPAPSVTHAPSVTPDPSAPSAPSVTPAPPADLKETFRNLIPFCDSLADALSAQPSFQVSPLPPIEQMGVLKPEYFIADQGRMGIVLLKIAESKESSFTYGTRSIEKLRQIIQDCQTRHPNVDIGLTGLTVMENDEMRISQEGSTKATLLSLVGVALMFIAAFGGFRHPLIAVAALMIGLGWTMGWVLLSVGHLNILSMSFGVILIGLGIDFGIHYVARYLENRHMGLDPKRAIFATSLAVGPGIVIGGVTTAAAFFMVGLSEFTGIAELGKISGGGILLCCAAAVVLIPPMILLADKKRGSDRPTRQVNPGFWLTPVYRHPKITVAASLAVTLYFATGLPDLWYDHNLLNMQPANLESVKLEMKLLSKWDKGAWFALSIADSPEELLERKRLFEEDPTLRVDEIVSRFPKPTPEKTAIIRQTGEALDRLPEQPETVPVGDPARLGELLAKTQILVEQRGTVPVSETDRRHLLQQLGSIRQSLRSLTPEQFVRQIAIFQQRLAGELLGRLHLIRLTSSPEPPDLNDLPESLVSRYVGKKSGKYLMRIYSVHEIWDMDKLSDFIGRVKKIDPNATGNPIQTYEASLQMQRSYKMASIYAFLIILPILYFEFRSLRYTLLALVPMSIGIVWAFGLMGILGIPFNPANTIVIPLIFGIGIDDGVHIVHDFRSQPGRYRITPSMTSAVFMTTLSTIIGFGSLMIADHRGLQSLGRVLVIGIASCTLVSLILFPALLSLVPPKQRGSREILRDRPKRHRPGRIDPP